MSSIGSSVQNRPLLDAKKLKDKQNKAADDVPVCSDEREVNTRAAGPRSSRCSNEAKDITISFLVQVASYVTSMRNTKKIQDEK